MKFSYWEIKSWFSNVDFTIVGSGIVGLSCALELKSAYPFSKIVVLERGILPQGASTKNAGFACFGSISEILEDLKSHTEEEVFELVKERKEGLDKLRCNLSDSKIDFKQYGGYELFSNDNYDGYDESLGKLEEINKLLKPIFHGDVFRKESNVFNFGNIQNSLIFNQYEGQIDTGRMMEALLLKVQANGVKILNSITVESFEESIGGVDIDTNYLQFRTHKLFIATNGFSQQLLNESVKPARAQVLITKPIENLNIKGTFHLNKGYYYFRNIDNRVLLGGGRNLDLKGEETIEFDETKLIQDKLEALLKETILPHQSFEIDHRWSGIMGVGIQKKPIVKQISNHVFCGIRLGGMGVAIGSNVGTQMAQLLSS
ncbi:FAD-dependent oxidoreductase [Hanstruepera neustonica]|uniref:FAD-dependent oxidoreductase n=1 Tax=Hanstruepera neustonica TaxID=1445657 RepID=A0A2K1E578_9FLAO|nr:FAD-dependent oxidoreductase [Hanstruepera neustonica]PNQ75445.1 FAD-dependent oxidoreductase [Hanstruepera neustonica]